MKSYGIYEVIENDEELLKLYHTDAIFYKSIDCGYHEEWTNEKILMFALKKGYEAKNIISEEYRDFSLHDRRPLKLETTNTCPKCKEVEVLKFENDFSNVKDKEDIMEQHLIKKNKTGKPYDVGSDQKYNPFN